MVIAFDGSRAFSDKRTGTENYSYQLLKSLAKIDQKNTYKVFLRPGAIVDKKEWPSNFQFITLNYPFLWTQVGLSIKTFTEPMDVLFVPAHTLPLIRAPWVKTVVTVHDLGSEYLPQTHQLKQRLYLSLMQNYQLQTATKLIAVSNATKADLVKKVGFNSKKIATIYEGFNDQLYMVQSGKEVKKVLENYKLKPQEFFLFVGTVQPRKNLVRLVQAFSLLVNSSLDNSLTSDSLNEQLANEKTSNEETSSEQRVNDLKLVIVGKKGWMSDEIYSLPQKLGIEQQVKFLDYVKDGDLPALYAGSIALVYPSLFEGFGLPILEAQASGAPVITSNISSMPEVTGKGAILVDPYSVEEIENAMIKVASHKSQVTSHKRDQLIKAGLENVKRFSWEKCAKETLRLLESC